MKKFEMPALLSLLAPGFGQLVKGHSAKMIAIWAISIFLYLNWRNDWLSLSYLNEITMGAYFILTSWSVYDAYNSDEDWKSGTL